MKKENMKFKLNMTKIDIIIILSTFFISLLISFLIFFLPTNTNEESLNVVVYYNNNELIKEPLVADNNESDPRYIILFKKEITDKYNDIYPTTDKRKFANNNLLLDDVIIKIEDKEIRIIQETSPNNICSLQGDISRVNFPLICAPNYVTVIIESSNVNGDPIITV